VEVGNKTIAQLAEELGQIPFLEGLRPEQLLEKVPFFDGMDKRLTAKVIQQALLLQYPPQAVICRQGDYEGTFYIILAGEVRVETRSQTQEHIHLAVLGKGDFFGEIGPLSGQPRTASVVARVRTVVLQIPKDIFLEMHRRSPQIKRRIDQIYIERSLQTHLRQVALFSTLADEVLAALANSVELINFHKDDVIIKEGDDGDCLYLIRSGFVKVSHGPLDREKILTYLREGSYFGEMALIHEEKRSANVVAMTDIEAVRIGKTEFQRVLALHPEVQTQIERTIAQRKEQDKSISHDTRLSKAMNFVVKKGLAQAREILVVDLEKCTGCDNCVAACAAVRGYPRIERRGSRLGHFLVPTSCFHCENPECLLCPVGGIVRDKNGEIHHTEFCNGCGGCARRCPYGNILMVTLETPAAKKSLWRRQPRGENGAAPAGRRIVVKCDMCSDYDHMACVHNCATGAMQVLTPEDLIKSYNSRGD
jgi:CRP-like cAMP-binding protein/Fe-S-cluster-containing dehydrogenase component